jgi:hypothetical protein
MPLLLLLLALLISTAGASAQPSDTDYEGFLTRLQDGDTAIDFRAFRMAYTETDAYAPYSVEADKQVRRLLEALFRDNDFDRAALIADSVLARNHTDIDGHFALMVVSREAGDSARADYHGTVARGLIDSIVGGDTDGRSPSEPWVVISTDEEYTLLRVFGLENQEQTLVTCNDHRCDHLQTVDTETGEQVDLYFDIEIPWQHLASELQGGASR